MGPFMSCRTFPLFPASVLALALLSGCSPSPDQAPSNDEGALTTTIRDDNAILPDDGNGASSANGGAMTADGPENTDRIPRALRGRWGLVPGDCREGTGDDKGLLVIGATRLRFYESVGNLRDIVEWAPGRLHATFAFTGEGQSWTREMTLDRGDDGTLTRHDFGRDAEPGPMTYTRCPAS